MAFRSQPSFIVHKSKKVMRIVKSEMDCRSKLHEICKNVSNNISITLTFLYERILVCKEQHRKTMFMHLCICLYIDFELSVLNKQLPE